MAKCCLVSLRTFRALVALAIVAVFAANTKAQTVSENRSQEPGSQNTEQRLTELEQQLEILQAQNPPPDDWAPGTPTLSWSGLVQLDYLWIGQNAASRATVGDAEDTFGFRRARLVAQGEAFDIVEYAAGMDFALSGRPSFLDAWIGVFDLPWLGTLRAGHFFEPFSLERYTVVRFTTFMERSLADTLAPARNLGLLARNYWGEQQRATWAIGWFRANSDVFGDDAGDVGGWAVTGRTTWLPIYDEANHGRTLVHLGGALSHRWESERQIQFQSFPEARAGTPGPTGIPPFVDTGSIAATTDQRLGTELLVIRGPLQFQAEYIFTSVDQIGGPRLAFHGAYAFVSYFLTGENRNYDRETGTLERLYPFENFFRVRAADGVATGRGAWEIAARWSMLDLTSHNIQGGTLNDITLALNWHLNPYTRVKWEYIYSMLDRAPIGDSFAHIAAMRFDMDF